MTIQQTAEQSSKAEEVLVSVIERNSGAQLRVSIIRLPGKSRPLFSVVLWVRDPFKEGEDWRLARPWLNGGTLLHANEVPRVAVAMASAVERAKQLGMEVR